MFSSTFSHKNAKRGFTLTELSIVLAMILIISVMVVTFTSLTSARAKTSTREKTELSDLAVARNAVDSWTEQTDTAESVFSTDETGKLTVTMDGTPCPLTLSDGKLSCTMPDGSVRGFSFELITDYSCEILPSASGHALLVFHFFYPDASDASVNCSFTVSKAIRAATVLTAEVTS